MRIISGKLKGKSLKFLSDKNTRPLKDSVRENIFNIITHNTKVNVNIENANILDLYSGVGSFGLECISRRANTVTFVEREVTAIKVLKKNLEELLVKNQVKVINAKVEEIHEKLKKEKFDIIFFDPPFSDSLFIENLKIAKKNKIYKKKHLVIIHREKKSKDNLEKFLEIINIKQYGRSKIVFALFN